MGGALLSYPSRPPGAASGITWTVSYGFWLCVLGGVVVFVAGFMLRTAPVESDTGGGPSLGESATNNKGWYVDRWVRADALVQWLRVDGYLQASPIDGRARLDISRLAPRRPPIPRRSSSTTRGAGEWCMTPRVRPHTAPRRLRGPGAGSHLPVTVAGGCGAARTTSRG